MRDKVLGRVQEIASEFLGSMPDSVELLTGDASTRSYFRIYHNNKSIIICSDPVDGPTFSLPKTIEVAHLLQENGVDVPEIYAYNSNRGFSVQEDVGNVTLEDFLMGSNKEEELQIYRHCIEEMVKIHSIRPVSSYKCFMEAFDVKKLMYEVDHTLRFYSHELRGMSQYSKEIQQEFSVICNQIATFPRVLVHRDYHCRNIMVENNRPKIIDFQDARMGIPHYDLVSLLDDCYYQVNNENYSLLKNYYLELVDEEWRNDFELQYSLMASQRLFKAIGSFAYMKVARKNDRYLKYIKSSQKSLLTFLKSNNSTNRLFQLICEYED